MIQQTENSSNHAFNLRYSFGNEEKEGNVLFQLSSDRKRRSICVSLNYLYTLKVACDLKCKNI